MKPEILFSEVKRLELLVQSHRDALRSNEAGIRAAAERRLRDDLTISSEPNAASDHDPFVPTLMTFPTVTLHARSGYEEQNFGVKRYSVVRDLQVDLSTEPPLYRLREERFAIGEGERLMPSDGASIVFTSDDPREVLEAAHEDIAEDELIEKLWPIVEAVEARPDNEPTPEEIVAVERILGLSALSTAERLRIRGDIGAFLEGRVPSGDFISRAIKHDVCPVPLYEGTREQLHFTIGSP